MIVSFLSFSHNFLKKFEDFFWGVGGGGCYRINRLKKSRNFDQVLENPRLYNHTGFWELKRLEQLLKFCALT